MAESNYPTYGELLYFLEEAEVECNEATSVADLLTMKLCIKYPSVCISRPDRFLNTVKRISAPTKPSSIGRPKLDGSPLCSYLRRKWISRTRHLPGCAVVSKELLSLGVTEENLQQAFIRFSEGKSDLCLRIEQPLTVGFYRDLYNYLHKWSLSKTASKTTIGRFFLAIDPNFKYRVSNRPDNIYLYVERLAKSRKPHSEHMSYGIEQTCKKLQSVVNDYHCNLQQMSDAMLKQQEDLRQMHIELEKAHVELTSSRKALTNITNKFLKVTLQRSNERRKHQQHLEATLIDASHYEDELLSRNEELSQIKDRLRKDMTAFSSSDVSLVSGTNQEGAPYFCFETKHGKVYNNAVRELYYKLLVNQVSPSKISSIIKTTLKSFIPSLNVDQLQLPSESCASYMRREELTTINLAHKASFLTEQGQSCVNLNSDGTTKAQRKIQGVAINDMVLSVNEVADGSADSMIADLSQELQKLRDVAHALKLPNADKINWTLIQSSSSDSASTQKKFNRLIEEKRGEDLEKFGPACIEGIELVENFCCMHLDVNLRKAFCDGIKTNSDDTNQRDNPRADVFVHEFCKLLGKSCVPEYGLGSLAFPDFLQLSCHSEKSTYYEQCRKIKLDRQVGSRYFVTAANAGKILFYKKQLLIF